MSLPYFLLGGLFLERNDRNHGNNFAVWKDEAQQGLQRKNCSVCVLMCKLNTFRDVHVDIQKGQIHIKYLSDVLIDLLPKSKND